MTGKVAPAHDDAEARPPRVAVWGDAAHKGNLISSIQLEEKDLEAHNLHLDAKYAAMTEAEQRADLFRCEDAEVLVVACNTPAGWRRARWRRCASRASARGLFRPLTLWPFR